MYTIYERNIIVENVIRYISSPPQCPCCEPSNNKHLLLNIGEKAIPLQNILEVKADHIEGYIDVGYYDEETKRNILMKVAEYSFEDFLN